MTRRDRQRPIIVTGCPRSGTTFVGKVIGNSPEVFYIYEPFNGDAPHNLGMPERFIELDEKSSRPHRERIDDIVALGRPAHRWRKALRGALECRARSFDLAGRLAAWNLAYNKDSFVRSSRVCIKDPLAFFAAEWMADTYDAQVVVMVRHPAGVISSYLALDWQSEIEAVRTRRVPATSNGLAQELADFRGHERDNVDGLLLQWRLFTEATLDLKARHPDWIFMIHDELCLYPEEHMRMAFDRLGLAYSDSIAGKLRRDTTGADAPAGEGHVQHRHNRNSRQLAEEWRDRLQPNVVDRVMAEAGPLWNNVLETL